LLLVEVGLLLDGGEVGEVGDDNKEGREDVEGRPFFSLST